MKVGVYLCQCGPDGDGQISAKVDLAAVRQRLLALQDVAYVESVALACSDGGQAWLVDHLREQRPDRVVMAACSPRDHEATFRRVMTAAGLNPFLLQQVNIREQVAWVTADPADAATKATTQIRAGIARVVHHAPLEPLDLDVSTDVLVVGGGPAGLKAALTLAEAGRHVTVVEKGPILGGLAVRFEEMFPRMECAPCLLEPMLADVLHGEHPGRIDVRLGSEVVGLKGFFGNFDVQIRTRARHVDLDSCVGCGACSEACPVSVPDPLNLGRATRKAVDLEFFGGLPNVPSLDESTCTRFVDGDDCTLCRDACFVDGALRYDDTDEVMERKVGAVVVAVGAAVYDLSRVAGLAYGAHPDVVSSWEAERLLAANGPTGGRFLTHDGRVPRRVAIVHCAGSLDPDHVPYCSTVCCQDAFKYVHLIREKHPDTEIVSLYRTIVAPGKEAFAAYRRAADDPGVAMVPYQAPGDVVIEPDGDGPLLVTRRDADGRERSLAADVVVLMAPVVAAPGLQALARTLCIGVDPTGFFEELNGRSDPTRSRVRGIYLAGACQAPTDIPGAMTQGVAAAGQALAALVEGREVRVEPITASVDAARCSGCRTCVPVCPYRAVDFDAARNVAVVNPALCAGCGTCVAACPSGAMAGRHFSDEAILAEIEAVLRR